MKTKSDQSQQKAFVEAARALECDESEERFDAALRKIATAKGGRGRSEPAKATVQKSAPEQES